MENCPFGIGRIHFDDPVDCILQKKAIVADEKIGGRFTKKKSFEPEDAFQIKMIGGFIEEK